MSQREKTGPQALEQWARNATEGRYPGVEIKNMTTSFRNGLAFCALIHRFHPELIDFESLDPNDIRGNCALAFEIAESKLGIPSLLDPEDFVTQAVPDRLSILTYVAQLYHSFKNLHKGEQHKVFLTTPDNKAGVKRPGSQLDSDAILEATRDVSPKRPVLLSSPTVCSVCQNPVFITERVLFAKKLFHRSCFRCSRCDCILNPQTADISPEGLFCLDKDCQKQFRQLNSRHSSRSVNGSPSTATEKQNGDIVMKENNNSPYNSLNNTPMSSSKSSTPSPVPKIVGEEIPSVTAKETVQVKMHEAEDENEKHIPNLKQETEVKNIPKINQHTSLPSSSTSTYSFPTVGNTPDDSRETVVADDTDSRETITENIVVNESSEDVLAVDDRLNIEEIVEPELHDKEKVRTVSFSAIVAVAKIESDSASDTQLVDSNLSDNKNEEEEDDDNNDNREGKIEEKDDDVIEDTGKPIAETTPPLSPKPKPKNAIDFLKENLETMSAKQNPFESDEEDTTYNVNNVETNNITTPTFNIQMSTKNETTDVAASNQIIDKSGDSEGEGDEKTSRNESGVGDSFESEGVKIDNLESGNVSGEDDPKLQISPKSNSEINHQQKDEKVVDNISTHNSSSTGLEGQGESKEKIIPPPIRPRSRVPKSPRSPSPGTTSSSTTTTPRPSPSPRKKGSANEIWKDKNFYPAELNPFESEDTFTLQPSDILVVKKSSSHERLPPVNPFEDDEDEEQVHGEKHSIELIVPPKSPVSSIRSADSISTSGSVKAIRKRRAPLPPSMAQPNSNNGSARSPALSPPNASNQLRKPNAGNFSPTVTEEGSPKKLIPASPDLLKGLKSPNNKNTGSGRKKRRAPPPKRHVTALPEAAIKTELTDLGIKEKELERQGINLEANIRRLMEEENENDSDRVDEMVIQLWNIVNEKNDILRRQTELDYLRRGHRLEEQQAEVEFQLRVLMETPIDQRQDDQEEVEEQLLQELLKIVDERAEVVDWLDWHRQINGEEDLHVSQSLSSFSSLSRSSIDNQNLVLPIKSETTPVEKPESISKSTKSPKDKNKEDGKGQKKDKFKFGLFSSKKRKSSKSSSKKQDEDKEKDESVKT